MKIGQGIKKMREQRGLKSQQLAALIGISPTSLSLIENDIKYPHQKTLRCIAKELEVPVFVIYFLSLQEGEISPSKKEYFRSIYPALNVMITKLAE